MSANKGLSSRAIIGSFYLRLEQLQAASWVNRLAMLFQSDQESETYKWLGSSPAMREWIGGRHAKGLRENGITIANKKFETTMVIPVDWMRRDKTGQILVRVDELAVRAVGHWQSLLTSLIAAGESGICYDGKYFFDTTHSEHGSAQQSNDITVDISTLDTPDVPANPSPKQMQQMVMAGVEKILGFKDDQGEPMNELARDFEVMVPTSYLRSASAALSNPLIGNGETNVLTNLDGFRFGLSVNPRLTWTDKLVVFRADGTAKPLIMQEETGVSVAAVAEGSQLEFDEDKHHYGVSASRNVGYGYWQHACLVQAV